MLTSLSLIFLVGLAMGAICGYLKLPRIIGMLVTGIVLGPYVLDLLDPSILSISADLRKMALIIILLKAGLSLNLEDLKKVGRPAVMMSFVTGIVLKSLVIFCVRLRFWAFQEWMRQLWELFSEQFRPQSWFRAW